LGHGDDPGGSAQTPSDQSLFGSREIRIAEDIAAMQGHDVGARAKKLQDAKNVKILICKMQVDDVEPLTFHEAAHLDDTRGKFSEPSEKNAEKALPADDPTDSESCGREATFSNVFNSAALPIIEKNPDVVIIRQRADE
jgi:hypothetical protein